MTKADKTPTPGRSNGYDPTKVKAFVERCEVIDEDIASATGAHMAHCKSLRSDKSEVLDEAKEAGIPKKELKRVLKARALERQVAQLRDSMDSDGQDRFDLIRHALGDLADTPLGQAANPAPEATAAAA